MRYFFTFIHLHPRSTPSFTFDTSADVERKLSGAPHHRRRWVAAYPPAQHASHSASNFAPRTSHHIASHFASHCITLRTSHRTSHHIASHFAHRIALHRISQSLRSIYRSFIHTQARLFAPAGGGFNAFRRRASTCSKSLRKPGELQLPSSFSPQCFGCGGMLQQNAVCNFHPSAFRQSSLMDRAGTHHRRTGPTIIDLILEFDL